MKKLLSYLLITGLLISCDSFHIEKRRYMKGFYVAHSKGKNTTSKPDETSLDANTSANTIQEAPDKEQKEINKANPEKIIVSRPIPGSGKLKPAMVKKTAPLTSSIQKAKTEKTIISPSSSLQKQGSGKNTISWGWLALLSSMLGLSFAGIYRYKKGGLMSAQAWAHRNKFKAQSLMVLTKFALMVGGFWFGVKLFEQDYLFPAYSSLALSSGYLLAVLIYPFRKSSMEKVFSFLRKKTSGLILSFSGLLLCMNLGNHVAYENANGINTNNHINKRCASLFEHKKAEDEKSGKSMAHFLVSSDDNTGTIALKVTLAFLALLSVIVLEIVILAYGCMLACDGAEGASAALIVGGTLVLAALSIITMYWISRIKLGSDTAKTQ